MDGVHESMSSIKDLTAAEKIYQTMQSGRISIRKTSRRYGRN